MTKGDSDILPTHLRPFSSPAEYELVKSTHHQLLHSGYYWGPMTMEEAHRILSHSEIGTFLIRYWNSSIPSCLSCTVTEIKTLRFKCNCCTPVQTRVESESNLNTLLYFRFYLKVSFFFLCFFVVTNVFSTLEIFKRKSIGKYL